MDGQSAHAVGSTVTPMVGIAWAALEVFGEQSVKRASLREVAKRAEVSYEALTGLFPDERALLLFALKLFEADSEEVALKASRSDGSRADVIAAVLEHQQRTPDRLRAWLAISIAATQEDHPARGFFADRAEFATGGVSGARADGDAERALLYLVVVDGLQLQWLANPGLDVESALRLFLSSSLYARPIEA
ncbi:MULTISPECIES: TetR family transcriptional regulator [unclassified Rathayibacter]|uniref:TetR family transcriptional regulator n=1 Tax=unclassified Rathayibacter TaxID=2609250 RepID=UPI00104FBD08|nr:MULTISPECIES: TetR family transcriptional regulator [unclassified Rathayibacter]